MAGPTFFALLVIAVAFLPVLALEGQEGKLFRPLAYTKNFAMVVAAVLAITLTPALRLLLVRRRERWPLGGRFQRFLKFSVRGTDSFPRRTSDHRPHHAAGTSRSFAGPFVWKKQVIFGALVLIFLTDSDVLETRLRNLCRQWTKARSFTCRRQCRAFRSRNRKGYCSLPTGS